MNKVSALVLVAWAIGTSASIAHSQAEEVLYRQLITNGVTPVSLSALDRVLKSPESFSADILYVACSLALREKRLEDAGFLFYIARFRAKYDRALFPPTQTGADSPMLAFAEANQELGSVLNPAIMAQPKVYAKVLHRVKIWRPKVTADYSPWWDYSKKGSEKEAEDAIASDRKEFIAHTSSVCALLQDPVYLSAFKTAQDYNLKLDSDSHRPSQEQYDAAFQTMERIEKEKGIEGAAASTRGHRE